MMTGTSLYSSIALALPPPKRIPLIFIASPMALYSSTTVGKNRNITDIGMMICSGKCSFFMEATNSLTVVDRTYGLSLSDQYWVRREDDPVKWKVKQEAELVGGLFRSNAQHVQHTVLNVVAVPMFEDDGEGGLTAMHHPFTSPKDMTVFEGIAGACFTPDAQWVFYTTLVSAQ